jgi:hypothetical protein
VNPAHLGLLIIYQVGYITFADAHGDDIVQIRAQCRWLVAVVSRLEA